MEYGHITSCIKCVPVCAFELQQINKVSSGDSCLRVMVESGGCSGFQYKFELDTNVKDDDRCVLFTPSHSLLSLIHKSFLAFSHVFFLNRRLQINFFSYIYFRLFKLRVFC